MNQNFICLSEKQIYHEIQFDSEDASSAAQPGVSMLDWPRFIINQFNDIAGMKVVDVIMTFSWWVFNATNNTFLLTEEGQDPVLVTIEEGNYNAAEMTTELSRALTDASLQAFTYIVVFRPNTQKFVIQNDRKLGTEPFTLTFGAADDPGNTNPRKYIGFDGGDNVSQTWDLTRGDVLVAPNVNNVTGPNYLYLNSRKMGQLVNMWLPDGAVNLGSGIEGPQIACIPIDVNPNGLVTYTDPTPQYFFNFQNMSHLTELDLYWTLGHTSGETPLQLHGLGFKVKMGIIENVDSSAEYNAVPNYVNKRIRRN